MERLSASHLRVSYFEARIIHRFVSPRLQLKVRGSQHSTYITCLPSLSDVVVMQHLAAQSETNIANANANGTAAVN